MTDTTTTKTPLTKEQKIAAIEAQIVKLQARITAIKEGKPEKAKAAQFVPNAGDKVIATVGRNTATSQAKSVEGTVLAVKLPAEGEKGAIQVRVRIYEGQFEEQTVTLYPAQLAPVPKAEDEGSDGIDDAPIGTVRTDAEVVAAVAAKLGVAA